MTWNNFRYIHPLDQSHPHFPFNPNSRLNLLPTSPPTCRISAPFRCLDHQTVALPLRRHQRDLARCAAPEPRAPAPRRRRARAEGPHEPWKHGCNRCVLYVAVTQHYLIKIAYSLQLYFHGIMSEFDDWRLRQHEFGRSGNTRLCSAIILFGPSRPNESDWFSNGLSV